MKFIITESMARDVQELQKVYQVTLISDKGLVFMHKDDWYKICQMLDECTQALVNHNPRNTLSDNFCFWSECFIVAYDKSEDFSCHAIANFEFFFLCCRRCNIWPVLLPMWDLVSYVRQFNAHYNKDALGCCGDVLIDVEDN